MGKIQINPKIKEKNCIGFMDETGLLNYATHRFFALGLLKLNDTSVLNSELWKIRHRTERFLNLQKKQSCKRIFEFKFKKITNKNFKFYCDLLELYFNTSDLYFCCFILDKEHPKIDMNLYNVWDYYIRYSVTLIKNNIKEDEQLFVVADYFGKPNDSNEYWEKAVLNIPNVYNATMIESHGSFFIQLVDILIGSIAFSYKIKRQDYKPSKGKLAVYKFVLNKLNKKDLMGNFTRESPNYFSVWEFSPRR